MLDERTAAAPVLLNAIMKAAERTGLSRSKIYEKIASGDLEAVRVDGRVYLTEAGLQAYIAKLPRVASIKGGDRSASNLGRAA